VTELLDVAAFNEKYRDWWTPNYWEAVIEMQAISVLGAEIVVYGTTAARSGTRWTLYLKPHKDRS
jgi:hypothetical protein